MEVGDRPRVGRRENDASARRKSQTNSEELLVAGPKLASSESTGQQRSFPRTSPVGNSDGVAAGGRALLLGFLNPNLFRSISTLIH